MSISLSVALSLYLSLALSLCLRQSVSLSLPVSVCLSVCLASLSDYVRGYETVRRDRFWPQLLKPYLHQRRKLPWPTLVCISLSKPYSFCKKGTRTANRSTGIPLTTEHPPAINSASSISCSVSRRAGMLREEVATEENICATLGRRWKEAAELRFL